MPAALVSSVVLNLTAPRRSSRSRIAPWAMSRPRDRIATRSHTCSTSWSKWLESSTVLLRC